MIIIKRMTMTILMMILMIGIIIAIMIMMIKIILVMAVVIIKNSPFEPGDFSTGSTSGQLLWLFSKFALKVGNVMIVHVDLAKYLFEMSGISKWGPLITDCNLSINCSICMRHICM